MYKIILVMDTESDPDVEEIFNMFYGHINLARKNSIYLLSYEFRMLQ